MTLSINKIAYTFSGMQSELEALIDEQRDQVQELRNLEDEINAFLKREYPRDMIAQEKHGTPMLRYMVWHDLYPLIAQVEENEAILERMKLWNSPVKGDGNVQVEDVKDVPITKFVEFNSRNKASCIWCADTSGDMHYYEEDNHVHCFACSQHGDVIDVVQQIRDCDFKEALDVLSTT